MVYCGYTVFLMVFLFIVVILLWYISLMLFLFFMLHKNMWIISMKIFSLNFFGDMDILINVWNLLFLFLVITISMSVLLFTISYMSSYKISSFLFLYLSFVFSMVCLILNNNFYWMMLGWDGLGVVSFLLIIFYMNYETSNNGLFTLFQNRIGDVFFVLFIVGVLSLTMTNQLIIKFGLLFLILGSCVKSAQFPFNSWLLSAMSAPTPISSLVHSSTLVVAGIYILLQFSYCLSDYLEILKFISVFSLFLSFLGLLTEFDMKKLIAYSTMSHVSLMMYFLSFKLYKIVYLHLNIHAMFKSLMFMCFGFVMLISFHSQDKRLVTLTNLNPLIKIIYYFSCLCLAGLPFLSAFFSKDFMIEKLMEFSIEIFYIFLLLLFLGVSVYYSLKLMSLYTYHFSFCLIEKSYLGLFSGLWMIVIMFSLINIYLSLMFSLSLELMSMKMIIYLFMVVFIVWSLILKMKYTFFSYTKISNFNEIWILKISFFDQYVYWNVMLLMSKFYKLSSIKFIVLINWWVLILFIVLF